MTTFSEFRSFLNRLGFSLAQADKAWVFRHRAEGMLVFRAYRDDEVVDERDLRSARKFLDLRGILDATGFDASVHHASTPA